MSAVIDPTGQFALDVGALASLKQQAKTSPAEALGKAAGQFEALFLQMLMKQMREALPQDGPLTSDATRNYTAMFDQQLAQQLSDHGLGLKKMIEAQLARHLGTATAGAAALKGGDIAGKALPTRGTTGAAAATGTPAMGAPPSAAAGRLPAAGSARSPAPPAAIKTSSLLPTGVQAFIDKLRPHAEAVARAMGVPAHYLLAQAGLETGWGKSLPRGADGASSHNLFGVKAGAHWHGAVVEATTTEVINGRAVHSVEKFRAYPSFTEAFQDFAKLLRGSPRYAGALAQAGDPNAYAAGLQRAGYATDPLYGVKLARAIQAVAGHSTASSPAAVQVSTAGADKKAIAA